MATRPLELAAPAMWLQPSQGGASAWALPRVVPSQRQLHAQGRGGLLASFTSPYASQDNRSPWKGSGYIRSSSSSTGRRTQVCRANPGDPGWPWELASQDIPTSTSSSTTGRRKAGAGSSNSTSTSTSTGRSAAGTSRRGRSAGNSDNSAGSNTSRSSTSSTSKSASSADSGGSRSSVGRSSRGAWPSSYHTTTDDSQEDLSGESVDPAPAKATARGRSPVSRAPRASRGQVKQAEASEAWESDSPSSAATAWSTPHARTDSGRAVSSQSTEGSVGQSSQALDPGLAWRLLTSNWGTLQALISAKTDQDFEALGKSLRAASPNTATSSTPSTASPSSSQPFRSPSSRAEPGSTRGAAASSASADHQQQQMQWVALGSPFKGSSQDAAGATNTLLPLVPMLRAVQQRLDAYLGLPFPFRYDMGQLQHYFLGSAGTRQAACLCTSCSPPLILPF